MPYVKKIVNSFKKRYGKKGESYYFGWMKNHPQAYKKGVATARKKGDVIIEHTGKNTLKKGGRKK